LRAITAMMVVPLHYQLLNSEDRSCPTGPRGAIAAHCMRVSLWIVRRTIVEQAALEGAQARCFDVCIEIFMLNRAAPDRACQ